MDREPKVGRRDATLVISRRRPVGRSEVGSVLPAAFRDVYEHLGRHGGQPEGPPFVIFHGSPVTDDPFEVEICAPVAMPTDPPEGWQLHELPAGLFATLLHVGPYDTIGPAYDELTAWIGAHDLAVMGPPREVYLSEGDTPPDQVRTILEYPVVEAVAPVPAR